MAGHHHNHKIPRGALYGAFAIVLATIVASAFGRATGEGVVAAPSPDPTATREFRFDRDAEGAVAVYTLEAAEPMIVLPADEAGFIAGVLRGLEYERRVRGIDATEGYRLIRSKDGRLTLLDLATDRRIELRGFGRDNYEAFQRLMSLKEQAT